MQPIGRDPTGNHKMLKKLTPKWKVCITLVIASLLCCTNASAWQAQDSMTGTMIEVMWPARPTDVATRGNHEIQYSVAGKPEIRLGEVTTWLSRCYGRYCPNPRTKTFEMNTFSERGLMYVFPLE